MNSLNEIEMNFMSLESMTAVQFRMCYKYVSQKGNCLSPLERSGNMHFISSESPIEIDCAKSATAQIIRVFLRRGNTVNRPTIQIPLIQTVNTLNLLVITEITGFNTKKSLYVFVHKMCLLFSQICHNTQSLLPHTALTNCCILPDIYRVFLFFNFYPFSYFDFFIKAVYL